MTFTSRHEGRPTCSRGSRVRNGPRSSLGAGQGGFKREAFAGDIQSHIFVGAA